MEIIEFLVDFVLHVDQYLNDIIQQYGAWTYAILFFIIFMETGFVITPFLPGDSLLFAAGTFAAIGSLDIFYLFFLLWFAAVLGDTVNYWIGSTIGPKAFEQDIRFLKKEYLEKTSSFTINTVARQSSWLASCPLCAPSPRLSLALAR